MTTVEELQSMTHEDLVRRVQELEHIIGKTKCDRCKKRNARIIAHAQYRKTFKQHSNGV